jgi:hypothetical protein
VAELSSSLKAKLGKQSYNAIDVTLGPIADWQLCRSHVCKRLCILTAAEHTPLSAIAVANWMLLKSISL